MLNVTEEKLIELQNQFDTYEVNIVTKLAFWLGVMMWTKSELISWSRTQSISFMVQSD